jgi:hypothetical protein
MIAQRVEGPAVSGAHDQTDWDALRDAALARHVESMREQGFAGPLPADVEFVRYISPEELGRVRAQCFRDHGIDAEATFDGGISFDRVPDDLPDRERLIQEAEYRCLVMYPVHPRYRQPLSPAQIRVIYDYYSDSLVPCLRRRGYHIEDPPEWETFLARFGTSHEWTPYQFVTSDSAEEWQAIKEDCPRHPPLSEIYGETLEQ